MDRHLEDTPKRRSPWGRAYELDPDTKAPAQHDVLFEDVQDAPDNPDARAMPVHFLGQRSALFGLALKTGFFTVITLGIYRFWMKTRLRRWYWSATRIGGLPLEYTGDPIEKLLGFLIAVVFLAFYIGVVNLLLMFASFAVLQGNTAAYLSSFIGVIPLWFYAQYRARRYVLARTRWRGLRFGLEPGAWGYAFRALGHWVLTILTAGLLWPRMTFKLEQYKTDRTFFGDHRLAQGGRWQMLFPALKWMFFAAAVGLISLALYWTGSDVSGVIGFILAGLMALYGLAYYRVETLIRLTNTKTLNGVQIGLKASPRRILFIHVFGYFLASLAASIPMAILGVLLISLQSLETQVELGLEGLPAWDADRWVILTASILVYFTIFLIWAALMHALVTMPVFRHYANGLALENTDFLDTIRQRPRDEHAEAEGFAEALDVGASI